MKELIYKNILKDNPRKKEISFEESDDRSRSRVVKKRIYKYFIKAQFRLRSQAELDAWIKENRRKGENLKNCHILRQKNFLTGGELILCKIIGEFFVVKDLTIYKILYVNTLKLGVSERSGA